MVFLSERKLIAGAIGLLTVALVMSRNKFLMSNLIEISHRVKHAVTGDNYDIMAAGIEQSPWFGRNDGVAIVTGSNTGVVR